MQSFLGHAMKAALLFAAIFSASALADDALYREFGEKPGLAKIVDDLYDNVLADPRTQPYFEDAPIKRIKQKLVEQFCVLLDGPCEYTGRTMKRTHEGQNIDRAAFNALVEDLQKAMDKNGVPFHSQNKLLAKLAPMYRDVQDRE
jgi:hemoglobin